MKGRKHRKDGGVNEAAEDLKTKPMRYNQSRVEDEAEERKFGGRTRHKRGGKTEMHAHGEHAKHHAGRKPRKSGGRLAGTEWMAAQKGTPPKGRDVSGSIND